MGDSLGGEAPIGTAFVLLPVLHGHSAGATEQRAAPLRLQEAVGLGEAIGLTVEAAEIVRVSKPRPGSLIGEGAIEQWAERIAQTEPDVVVIDAALSPVQQRTLEQRWKTKVIDRTGLILEIFGERARTAEGRLQVELAHLSYQRSRLVRSWTHLERQRGGAGFMGGPGERQIELDRRLLDQRIDSLGKELHAVRRTRGLHRKARERVPYPVIALIGYTNAGKSTLFNRLTAASVMAKDMVFATLDPTMRRIALPGGQEAILSDTVGFITDLPTTLVAAFRATLEEVQNADLILHLRDISAEDTDAQQTDVNRVLESLDIEAEHDERVIEVWNKTDLLPPERRAELEYRLEGSRLEGNHLEGRGGSREPVPAVSALSGTGIEDLLRLLETRLFRDWEMLFVTVEHSDGRSLAWIYDHCDVRDRADDEFGATLAVRVSPRDFGRLKALPITWRYESDPAAPAGAGGQPPLH